MNPLEVFGEIIGHAIIARMIGKGWIEKQSDGAPIAYIGGRQHSGLSFL
jgi:hypothetical protein